MKKILIGLMVIVVLIGGGIFYVFSNIDELVKTAIETAGTDTLGSSVQVGSVEIDLIGGTASIFDFSIANLQGYSDQTMMSFSELSVSLDLNNLSSTLIGINSIVARDPAIHYETVDGVSNLDIVSANLSGDSSATEQSSSAGPKLAIASVLIENIQASLQSSLLPSPLQVNLGDIRLENLEGTPEEIASQIMGPVASQLSSSAADALLTAIAGIDVGGLVETTTERVGEELEQLEDKAKDALDKVIGEDLRKGLGGLLN